MQQNFPVEWTKMDSPDEQTILGRPEGGVVSFCCGSARSIGFDARHEPDPNRPDNTAHANVYFDGSRGEQKRAAKKLATQCRVEHLPTF